MTPQVSVKLTASRDGQMDRHVVVVACFIALWLDIQYGLLVAIATQSVSLLVLSVLIPVPIIIALHRVFFNKLSSFPGPTLWSATRLPMLYYLCRGTLPQKILELHLRYGEVVRIAPEELSFVCEEAWGPVYMKPNQKPQLRKDPTQFLRPLSGNGGLFQEDNDQIHGQVKRHFSHAFADKTLAEHELVIISYITLFLDRIHAANGAAIDICDLLNCLTFDVVGELAFSQSFGSLQSSALHPWITNIFSHVSTMIVCGMLQKFEVLYSILTTLMYSQIKAAEEKHNAFIVDRVDKRLAMKTERRDFMTHVQNVLNIPNGVTYPQLYMSVGQIIIGGSETTSTVLSATLYLLLTNPPTLQKLLIELRTLFQSIDDINMSNVNNLTASGRLEYLHAVIQEGLRLYAPTPGNLTRVTPEEGVQIGDNCFVPGGTLLGVNLHAAGRYPGNFKDAERFVPERWLKVKPCGYENDKLKVIQAFSIGPRNCIGKNLANIELRLILARLLYSFDIELDPRSKGWDRDMKIWGFYDRPELYVRFRKV